MNTGSEPLRLFLPDASATVALGTRLGQSLEAGAVLLLEGALGSGKTTLVKGLVSGLGGDPEEVTSPSFTLISIYRSAKVPVYHVDLYRLDPLEVAGEPMILEALSATDGVIAVEWAERLPRQPIDAVQVVLRHAAGPSGASNGREAVVQMAGNRQR